MSIMGDGLEPVGPLFSKRFLKFASAIIIITLIVFLILWKRGELPDDEPLIPKTEEVE